MLTGCSLAANLKKLIVLVASMRNGTSIPLKWVHYRFKFSSKSEERMYDIEPYQYATHTQNLSLTWVLNLTGTNQEEKFQGLVGTNPLVDLICTALASVLSCTVFCRNWRKCKGKIHSMIFSSIHGWPRLLLCIFRCEHIFFFVRLFSHHISLL